MTTSAKMTRKKEKSVHVQEADGLIVNLKPIAELFDSKGQGLLNKFVSKVQGRSHNGFSIAFAWISTMNMESIGCSESTLSAMESRYDRIIDAIIMDPEVAERAKSERERQRRSAGFLRL